MVKKTNKQNNTVEELRRTHFCALIDQSKVAIGRGEQTVNLIGPTLRPAHPRSPIQDAPQAGQVSITLTRHLETTTRMQENMFETIRTNKFYSF